MIKNNFNAQGYKAPVCKVVRVHVEGALLQDSYGALGKAGANVDVDYDDQEY